MNSPTMSTVTIALVLNRSRRLWEGSDEAPAVRQIAYSIAELLPPAERRQFVMTCGYEWPAVNHEITQ